jgi:hypothetical protein
MSKMGRAYEWVQENGLENDPEALAKYIKHLAEKGDVNSNIRVTTKSKAVKAR